LENNERILNINNMEFVFNLLWDTREKLKNQLWWEQEKIKSCINKTQSELEVELINKIVALDEALTKISKL